MSATAPVFDYLLDTSLLSRLLDTSHKDHGMAISWEQTLPTKSRKIISVVALAELRFGLELAKRANRVAVLPRLEENLRRAELHDPLRITRATGYEYAVLKANLAKARMPQKLAHAGKTSWGNPESWLDEYTGRALGTQENDLWQCAQAVERNLVLATCDKGVQAIAAASAGAMQFILVTA